MFTLKIKTDNAAFEDEATELARILRETANKIENGKTEGVCKDINGNTVGDFSL